MLDTQKIKKMHKLAVYESGEGKQHLATSNYYRSDYIGLALIKNFFLTTIGYGLLVLGWAGYRIDYLMSNAHRMNITLLIAGALAGYVILLVIYSVLTYIFCTLKYARAQKGIQKYYKGLGEMKKIYDREESRNEKITGRETQS
ncbi:MAG TPA: hypothetical protein H9913_07075 [Candidatus Blautia stercoripullorum]|uniref:Uncharacterized protein n=1 Tax=Candidatus Blautia stercoripullorum TaxID=2838502 RepID=A0A9D2R9Q9_9FIRM|nr:hypothetical protein [Candidatus Blautia stercoripullorum]